MRWKKYTIHTTTGAEDLVSAMLMELGVEGVQIEDNVPLSDADTKGMFIDILPTLPPDDGTSRVSFFLHEKEDGKPHETGRDIKTAASETADAVNADNRAGIVDSDSRAGAEAADDSYTIHDRLWSEEEIRELLLAVEEGLTELRGFTDIGEGRIEIGATEETDWQNNWKQFFKPFLVEDMLVKPTWEAVPECYLADIASGAVKLLEMDPGTAFGTGTHETTQLCMHMLKKYMAGGERVLDIGTGSGILGIAALKRGAASVAATDLDEACEAAVAENLAANAVPEELFSLKIGDVLSDEAFAASLGTQYDLALANILAPVIVALAAEGKADRFVRKGGILITSGIIDTKEDAVREAFQKNRNWKILEVLHQGEWVSFVAERT